MKKAKRIELKDMTREQRIEAELELFHRLKPFHIAPDTFKPTYAFSIGDHVVIGALNDPVIIDIRDEGRAIVTESLEKVSQNHEKERYEMVIKAWAWYDVRPKSSTERISDDASRYCLSYGNSSLLDILSKYLYFGVDMEPEYQRDYVWTLEDQRALIGSILKDLDIGRFVFRKMPYGDNAPAYQVVDGKQRIRAIVDFYLNRFTFEGKYFNDLCPADRRVFTDHGIITANISEHVDLNTVIEIFIRLNTTGKVMSKDHIDAIKKKYLKEK
jgi:hypothetical protein